MNDRARDLLYRSLDEALSAAEREELASALAASAELRTEKQQLETMRASVAAATAESFALGFADRVMRRVKGPETRPTMDVLSDTIRRMFRYVAAAAVPLCIALVIWNVQIDGSGNEAQAETIWQTPVETLLSNGQ